MEPKNERHQNFAANTSETRISVEKLLNSFDEKKSKNNYSMY